MSKSKVHMPKELEKKCQVAIHSASTAAAAAGAIPIPVADTVPISTAQVGMIVALGKIFDVTLSQSVAKSIVSIAVVQGAGRAVVSSAFKLIPGLGTIAGGVIGGSTAAALTEALGWSVADDFYRLSTGDEPENLVEVASDLKEVFKGVNASK